MRFITEIRIKNSAKEDWKKWKWKRGKKNELSNLKTGLQKKPKEQLILMLISRNIENFNETSANSQECMSSSSKDEKEVGEICIFRNVLCVNPKAREGWIQCCR